MFPVQVNPFKRVRGRKPIYHVEETDKGVLFAISYDNNKHNTIKRVTIMILFKSYIM